MRKEIRKERVLLVDDSQLNRAMLAEILAGQFEILEAGNGAEALKLIQKYETGISLILLDIMMPVMDGFELLAIMNKNHWIENIPVIMISAENGSAYVDWAYELGATDYISRPFDAKVVQRRAQNTIMLYAKQKHLIGLVTDQVYDRVKGNWILVSILSHIVEFRNGESGLHVMHINSITGILLECLAKKTDQYGLSWMDRLMITLASSLHDIGKIGIDDKILNKPGKLTKEEYEIMKTHAEIGASMLSQIDFYKNEKLVKVAHEICRWHHERYDGKGYPDGLKGEEIPISAQVVALADVYDALVSERVYKPAYSHKQAVQMILNGECGAFNPLLLECLVESQDRITKELELRSVGDQNVRQMRNVADELLQRPEFSIAERTQQQLEYERMKDKFYSSLSKEIRYEYTTQPMMLTFSEWGAKTLGIDEVTLEPEKNEKLLEAFPLEEIGRLKESLFKTTPENPEVENTYRIRIDGTFRDCRIVSRVIWSNEALPQCNGSIGRILIE